MNNIVWLELDEAARWLSTKPEIVICLMREGVLGSRRKPRDEIFVRAEDVRSLAEVMEPPPRERPRRQLALDSAPACVRAFRPRGVGELAGVEIGTT